MTESGSTVVAAFDFDGTLTRSDTVVPFLRLVGRRRRRAGRLASRSHEVALAAARRDRDRLREIATEVVFAGVPMAEVTELAAAHGAAISGDRLRPDTTARLGWHRDQGHRVVIVSASYEPYVSVVGERLGIDGVVATRLEVGDDGMCTGRLDGGNCRAAEKVRRLALWFEEHGLARDAVELWAYGDSEGDRQLLDHADHPVWVRARLGSVAAPE